MISKQAKFSRRNRKPTQREEKIFKLRNLAQCQDAARKLFSLLEENCKIILQNPNEANNAIIRNYNRLVMASELPLPERKQLLMEESITQE